MFRHLLIAVIILLALLIRVDASIYSNCPICHDPQGLLGGRLVIDTTALGQSVHGKINERTAIANGADPVSGACWACHDSDGVVIADEDVMGDRYKNPFNCTACHLKGGEKEGAYGAPLVSNHFTNSALKVSGVNDTNISSCISCHEIPGMVLPNKDTDFGTFPGDGERRNGGNLSYYHYGKERIDLKILGGTAEYCKYCHSNKSEFASVFKNTVNENITNHSLRFPSPACSQCHGTGTNLHALTLDIPERSDILCLGCHASDRVTGPKSRHNGSISCTVCHGGIHPVNYLQKNFTYGFTPISCPDCHETGVPLIPPLQHSNNPANGSVFGNYWKTKVESCFYCHGNTLHSSRAFGKAANIQKSPGSRRDFNTYWCANCHYNSTPVGEYFYNGTSYVPAPPEITNPLLFNHSSFIRANWTDGFCKNCHGKLLVENTIVEFVHRVSTGPGGPDCAQCHDTGGVAPKRINFSAFREGVHRNLNSNALNNTTLSETVDKACWACHGEGVETSGHPDRYKNPRRCSNNDCHSLSQSFKAPPVYSHFRDANLNSNPDNVLNYNITTKVSCEVCHSNSLNAESQNPNASVPHYAPLNNLVDSINCIFCHLDKDHSIKWGNATEINKNRSALKEMDKEKNKFIAHEGDFLDLGMGYRIKVRGISVKRGSAEFELYKGDTKVDSGLFNTGNYSYEENLLINNASARVPVVVLNITDMFLKDNEGFIQFEGFRIKRLHYENKTTPCYRCHFNGDAEKHKYQVIDRKNKYVFYTEILFNSSDRKEYDQEDALRILANETPQNTFTSIERPKRKTLRERETWKLAENYELTLLDVTIQSDSAKFLLNADGNVITDVAKKGETLDYELPINYLGYEYRNITLFRANISEILQGNTNIAVLEDIIALSPDIKKIDDNTTISGYNTSWLWENNTFLTGKIPSNFHSPLLHEGKDGGADCRSCHSTGELGFHTTLNSEAPGNAAACWACHGNGKEPKWHPATYKNPRKCKSCHVERENPFYNATYVGDEKHGTLEGCNICHAENIHKIIKFDVVPGISSLSLSMEKVYAGEPIRINVTAIAGYMMRVRGAQYYIDSPAATFPMFPVAGSFDEQIEEVSAEINTTGMRTGVHTIYVRAMERNNKWGQLSTMTFEVNEKDASTMSPRDPVFKIPFPSTLVVPVLIILALIWRRIKAKSH